MVLRFVLNHAWHFPSRALVGPELRELRDGMWRRAGEGVQRPEAPHYEIG